MGYENSQTASSISTSRIDELREEVKASVLNTLKRKADVSVAQSVQGREFQRGGGGSSLYGPQHGVPSNSQNKRGLAKKERSKSAGDKKSQENGSDRRQQKMKVPRPTPGGVATETVVVAARAGVSQAAAKRAGKYLPKFEKPGKKSMPNWVVTIQQVQTQPMAWFSVADAGREGKAAHAAVWVEEPTRAQLASKISIWAIGVVQSNGDVVALQDTEPVATALKINPYPGVGVERQPVAPAPGSGLHTFLQKHESELQRALERAVAIWKKSAMTEPRFTALELEGWFTWATQSKPRTQTVSGLVSLRPYSRIRVIASATDVEVTWTLHGRPCQAPDIATGELPQEVTVVEGSSGTAFAMKGRLHIFHVPAKGQPLHAVHPGLPIPVGMARGSMQQPRQLPGQQQAQLVNSIGPVKALSVAGSVRTIGRSIGVWSSRQLDRTELCNVEQHILELASKALPHQNREGEGPRVCAPPVMTKEIRQVSSAGGVCYWALLNDDAEAKALKDCEKRLSNFPAHLRWADPAKELPQPTSDLDKHSLQAGVKNLGHVLLRLRLRDEPLPAMAEGLGLDCLNFVVLNWSPGGRIMEALAEFNNEEEAWAVIKPGRATIPVMSPMLASACTVGSGRGVVVAALGVTGLNDALDLYRVTPDAMYTGAVRMRKVYDARVTAGQVPCRPTLGNEVQANTCLGGHRAAEEK
jgi:hypothetical protein